MSQDVNDQLILVSGKSGEGKSASLMSIRNQPRWMYLNSEAGKRLPFKNDFQPYRIDDPYQVHEAFDYATGKDDILGIVIDSLTFLMDMYETMYVIGSTNTMAAWGNYQQYFKILMQDKVVKFGKPVIITAHVLDTHNEAKMRMDTAVPIKGALKNNGIEAYFSTNVSAKKVTLKELEPYANDLLTITEDDELVGYKHVFQTSASDRQWGCSRENRLS